MTLLPETLCIDAYTAEKVMEPPDEILITILALSSPTDLPRIFVCARGRPSWEEKSTIYETRSRFVLVILDLDRETRVRSSRKDISCFLFDDEEYQAKVRMFYSRL